MKKIILLILALSFINNAFSITDWQITCSMEPWNYVVAWGCLTNYPSCGSNAQSSGCSASCIYCGNQIDFCADNTDASGTCACNENYENCDGINSNGCESDLRSNNFNCGTCGNACENDEYCWKGECTKTNSERILRGTCSAIIQSCPANSAPNTTNINNFGTNPCVWGSEPKCQCLSGYSNCDSDISNGCEVNTNISLSHCGKCNNPVEANQWCSNGLNQSEGMDFCSNEIVDLKTHPDNCGSCNNKCLDNQYCWKATCINISSINFYRGTCSNSESVCINSVADNFTPDKLISIAPTTWQSSTINCALSGDPKCNCSIGYLNCINDISDGCESDIRKTNNYCGSCTKSCQDDEYCWQGTCVKIRSESTYIRGSCSGTTSVCPANSAPDSSGSFGENTCDYNGLPKCSCNQGFVNNDNNETNGCELDLRRDNYNCGKVGERCFIAPCIDGECGKAQDYAWGRVTCTTGIWSTLWPTTSQNNNNYPFYAASNLKGGWEGFCGTPKDSSQRLVFEANPLTGSCPNTNNFDQWGFFTCNYGYKNCNHAFWSNSVCSENCETNVLFNRNNCGECGKTCDSNELCVNNECVTNYAKCRVGCSCTSLTTAYVESGKGSANTYAPGAGSGANHDYNNWANVQTCSCPWFGWGYNGDAYCKCLPGYASCGNYDSFDGCETNTLTNKLNCGGCGKSCYSLENRCTGAVYLNYETQAQIESICEVGCDNSACTKATKYGGYCQATSDCVKGTFQAEGSELQEGLYFFITSDGKDVIRTFRLTTPWNLTTLQRINEETLYHNFDSVNNGVTDGYPRGFFSKNDGSLIYVIEGNNKKVMQYNLGTPFNPESFITATKKSFTYSAQSSSVAEDLFIGDSGTKLYLIMENNIYQYSITNWDISTAIYGNKLFNAFNYDTEPKALFFNNDGTKLYILGSQNNAVFQFSLSIAWDISTATIDTVTETSELIIPLDCPESQVLNPNTNTCVTPECINDDDCYDEQYDIICHNDGRWDSMCINNFDGYPGDDELIEIIIPSSETITYNVFVSISDAEPQSIFFSNDGKKLFAIGSIEEQIMSWDLITPWDLTTAFFSNNNFANVKTYSTTSTGLSFSPDGTKMFVTGDGGLYEFYNIPALGCTGGIEESPGVFNKWCCPPDKCGFKGECKDNNEGLMFNNVYYFCKLGEWKEVSRTLDMNKLFKADYPSAITMSKLYFSDLGISQLCTQSNYRACTMSQVSYSYKYCLSYNVVFDGIFNIETINYVPIKVIEQNLHDPYFKYEELVNLPERSDCEPYEGIDSEGVIYCGQI